ncbi:putative endonuclease [Luteibacter sp. OK325]|uniref:YraN family protein n=1 Tax=Luteibacter sp. OK325 TaxID=2135670 RepID=UPI000D3A1963|nr:YraN family protein [Luteibacter sp. OK325]PTR34876.1 putative endonuclease [Luteibacter sp. OK325]
MTTKKNTTERRATGDHFEGAALSFLQARGLRLVRANFLCRHGEIDLVMRDGDTVVFVEVRYRRSAAFGGALGSVTAAKRRKLISAAHLWLAWHPHDARRPCRFDVLAFEGDAVEWVRGAFETSR